jgi:hypothetical protein
MIRQFNFLFRFFQAWLMFHFITFNLRRMRETKANSSSSGGAAGAAKNRKSQQEKAKAR